MPGLFSAIEIGRRALLAQQAALQTMGHNIANVNTPGYSRQRVSVQSTFPETATYGQLGTGVSVVDVRNVRDLFLGNQVQQENKELGQWSYKSKIMNQIESLFNEPNDNTISEMLSDFWNAWSDLSTDPNSVARRQTIVSQATRLTNGFHDLASQLNNLRDSVDRDLVTTTADINRLTSEIAAINEQIASSEGGGLRANDLHDGRDLLIDELSMVIDVNTFEDSRGNLIVQIGRMTLVDGDKANKLEVKISNNQGTLTPNLVWKGTDIGVTNLNGQLKGLLDVRDKIIPEQLGQLDLLARNIVEQVNSIHQEGYGLNGATGNAFFDVTAISAFNIRVRSEIVSDSAIVSSSGQANAEGDNSIALSIAALDTAKVMRNSSQSISDYYNTHIGNVGVQTAEAASFSQNYALVLNQLENARQSVQGVSLDEEMTNMIKFQHAYDAAARVITVMDEALDTVIRGMGIVGR